MKHLGWVTDDKFKVENPLLDPTNPKFNEYIWLENFDKIKNVHKVVCSEKAVSKIVEEVNNLSAHKTIYGKTLAKK